MPYLEQAARKKAEVVGPRSAGDLNYLITKLCLDYLGACGTPRYMDFNAVVGALECAKLEMYRRMVAPYETNKHALNGDVYVL